MPLFVWLDLLVLEPEPLLVELAEAILLLKIQPMTAEKPKRPMVFGFRKMQQRSAVKTTEERVNGNPPALVAESILDYS